MAGAQAGNPCLQLHTPAGKEQKEMTEVYAVIGEWFGYAGGVAMFMGILAKCINVMVKAFTRGEIVV